MLATSATVLEPCNATIVDALVTALSKAVAAYPGVLSASTSVELIDCFQQQARVR
jgi:hypothetical protein